MAGDDSGKSEVEASLSDILEGLKRRVGLGHEVSVEWIPGAVKFRGERRLEEEVIGDKIFIYAEDPSVAGELVAHGFVEWLLNRHTKRYRMLINKLIEIFEEIQYEDLFIKGDIIGGGAFTSALRNHIEEGLRIVMTEKAATTLMRLGN